MNEIREWAKSGGNFSTDEEQNQVKALINHITFLENVLADCSRDGILQVREEARRKAQQEIIELIDDGLGMDITQLKAKYEGIQQTSIIVAIKEFVYGVIRRKE